MMKKLAKGLDCFLKIGFWGLIIMIPLILIAIVGLNTLFSEFTIPNNLSLETSFDYKGLTFLVDSNFENSNFVLSASGISVLIASVVWIYNIVQIRGILEAVMEDKPFSMEFVKYLKKLAFGIIIGSLLTTTADSIVTFLSFDKLHIMDTMHQVGIQVKYNFFMFEDSLVIEGLFILLLAHIFQYGLQLQEEYDATL